MRFLVDRCAGHGLAQWLRGQGHDVREPTEVAPDPCDQALLLPNVPAGKRLLLMARPIARYPQELTAGVILTVGTERVRISRAPPISK